MKAIIKEIMDKQGISKSELLRQTKLYKIDNILYGSNCKLKEEELNLLMKLVAKPSCKVTNTNEPLIQTFNGKKYLNVLACLPTKSRTGFNLYFKEVDDSVVVWYQPKTLKKCEFMFKKHIPLNEFFITCLGLSVGDGLNNPSVRNNHYTFASINFELTYLIYNWLRNRLNVSPSKIQISLRIPIDEKKEPTIGELEKKFACEIKSYKVTRCANKTLFIQVGNSVFQCFYLSLFNKLKGKILNTPSFRKAFLKGLFAAEGHVKHSVYGTLESISFAFNPYLETDLMLFVKKCLENENIPSKKDKEGRQLHFCGYEKMVRFYLTSALSLHKGKEEKFIELIRNAEPVLHLKESYLKPLRKYSQHKLARFLGCSQSAVSLALKRKSLSLKHLIKIADKVDVSLDMLLRNTKFISISTSTVKNKQAIRFLLSEKWFKLIN